MDAYIIVPEGKHVTSGRVNFFNLNSPFLYSTVDQILQSKQYDSTKNHIAHIKFANDDEVRSAIMASYSGNSYDELRIEVLSLIEVTVQ